MDPLIVPALIAAIPATAAAYNARAVRKELRDGSVAKVAHQSGGEHIEDQVELLREGLDRLEAKMDDHISDDHEHWRKDGGSYQGD